MFYAEVVETLDPVPGMDLQNYQNSLIERFTNPSIVDHVLRICEDGSAKIPGFVLPTLHELLGKERSCMCFGFVLAGWYRFLEVADNTKQAKPIKLEQLVKTS